MILCAIQKTKVSHNVTTVTDEKGEKVGEGMLEEGGGKENKC